MNDEAATATQTAQDIPAMQSAQLQGGIAGAGATTEATLGNQALCIDPAAQAEYEAGHLKYTEGARKFAALPAKYNVTVLALSIEYIKRSTTQGCIISDEDLAIVEAYQEQSHLMAAATLCSTGRF